jgi:predicted nucleotidyltransferase
MSETKQLCIEILKGEIARFCQRHHIRKLSLFGSVLRDDFTPQSDIDFLVEFEPGKTPGYFKIVSMEMELSELLEGRKIDLRTPNELSVYFRDRVMAEAVVQYDSN